MGYYNHSAQTPGQRRRTSCQTREVGLLEPRHAFLHSVCTFPFVSQWPSFLSQRPSKKKIDMVEMVFKFVIREE